jgi:hypothetical protein
MHAVIGDELLVRGRHVDDADRIGVIIGIHGENGSPPYLVRWTVGQESVFFPSADTLVEHLPSTRPTAQ